MTAAMTAPTLVDAAAGAVAVGRPVGTIHYWSHRGWIRKHGTRTTRTFDLAELHDVAAALAAGETPERKHP